MAIVARYDYTGPLGEPRIRKVRFDPKGFALQSWSEERGRYLPRIRDEWLDWADRAMYRLPEMLDALRAGDPVWLCEGEKDADAIRSIGVAASSHWQGAGKFEPEQADWFTWRGNRSPITIVCDNDAPGWDCGLNRYRMLRQAGVAKDRLRVIAPPWYKPRIDDAADALQAGLGLSDFWRVRLPTLKAAAARYKASSGRTRANGRRVLEVPAGEDAMAYFRRWLTGERSGDEFRAYCPLHEDPKTSKSPSASLNFKMAVWHCQSCGQGGAIHKLEQVM